MQQRYDSILEENASLKKALATSKSVIERAANDYETLRQIHEEYKTQQDRIKKENEEMNSKLLLVMSDKKELENQFDTTIRNLKTAIEQKQREIEEIQQKVIPSFDYDVLRIKIINELDIPHQLQLEQKQDEIDKLQDLIYDLKNQIVLMQSKLEMQETQYQNELKMLKDKNSIETSNLVNEINELTDRINDNQDFEKFKQAKREQEDLRVRLSQKMGEADDLRRDRDKLKEEKNEVMILYSKQLEQERNDKRLYKSESEKLSLRSRFIEDENKKNKIKMDSLASDLEIITRERDNLQDELRKKDEMIHQSQRRLAEIEQDNIEREKKSHEQQMKVYNEEHEKFLEERNIRTATQREFEQLKKNYEQLNQENTSLRDKINKDVSQLKTENMTAVDERDKLKRQLGTLMKENENLQNLQQIKDKQLSEVEREYDSVRRRYRETLQKVQQFETSGEMPNKTQAMTTVSGLGQCTTRPISDDHVKELQTKNQRLKDKLKQANGKIMELLKFKIERSKQVGIESIQPEQMSEMVNATVPYINQMKDYMPPEDDELLREIQKTFGPRRL